MKQLDLQNLPDDSYPAQETLKQIEVGGKTILQNPNPRNSNPFSEQMTIVQGASPFSEVEIGGKTILQNSNPQDFNSFSEQMTIIQGASPFSEVEIGSKTILQNPNPQGSNSSVVLADNVSLPQKPRMTQQIGSSSQPKQRVEARRQQNPNAAEVTVVQNHNPIAQHLDSVIQNHTQQTIVQYSDSAIHSSGEQTVCQAIPSLSSNRGQTLIPSKTPKSSHSSILATMPKNQRHIPLSYSNIRNTFRTFSSFPSRFTSTIRGFFLFNEKYRSKEAAISFPKRQTAIFNS